MNPSTPARESPVERYPGLRKYFEAIEKLERLHFEVAAALASAGGGDLWHTDFVLMGVLERSLDILDAAQVLIERWNFTAAAPLLRMQLDSLLRVNYLSKVGDAEAVSREVFAGTPFYKLKDAKGKPLTDARLRDYARARYDWIDRVYEATSKLIHLSDRHVFGTVQSINEENRTVQHVIGVGAPNWPEERLEEFLQVLITTTDALLKTVGGWAGTKDNLHNQRGPDASRTDV
jgi:hypothetical protein